MRVEKAMRQFYESAADVYDRITEFRETLKTDINIGYFQPPAKRHMDMSLVIISHGLTIRVFLMRWFKWTVAQFEGLHNLDNEFENHPHPRQASRTIAKLSSLSSPDTATVLLAVLAIGTPLKPPERNHLPSLLQTLRRRAYPPRPSRLQNQN
ncbi:hypothetical protein AHAS_Ahas14G0174600 [Arachis hypogaea]